MDGTVHYRDGQKVHVSVRLIRAGIESKRCELKNRVTCTPSTSNPSSALKKVPYLIWLIACIDWTGIILLDFENETWSITKRRRIAFEWHPHLGLKWGVPRKLDGHSVRSLFLNSHDVALLLHYPSDITSHFLSVHWVHLPICIQLILSPFASVSHSGFAGTLKMNKRAELQAVVST